MQFSKIRGWGYFLENLKNPIGNKLKNKNQNNSAFSLIELSIVLIIIGLLVAGVTGGASLIESAKMKVFINEVNSQKQAINIFYAAKGRYPGDIDNIGKFGMDSGYTYTKDDFKAPFNDDSYIPTMESASYAELYIEGIFDFKPEKDNNRFHSKIFKDVFYYFFILSIHLMNKMIWLIIVQLVLKFCFLYMKDIIMIQRLALNQNLIKELMKK